MTMGLRGVGLEAGLIFQEEGVREMEVLMVDERHFLVDLSFSQCRAHLPERLCRAA